MNIMAKMKHSRKWLLLAGLVAGSGVSVMGQAPEQKRVVCIVNSDTVIATRMEGTWTEAEAGADGEKREVRRVMIVTGDGDEVRELGPEDAVVMEDLKGGKEERVVVKKMVVANGDGPAQVHTIKVVNGDTVMDEVHEESLEELRKGEKGQVFIHRMEGNGSMDGGHVDVQVKSDGAGGQIIVVKVKSVKIEEVKGDEAMAPAKASQLNLKDLEHFPNPNQGKFTLRFGVRKKDAPVNVQIHGMDGRVIYTDALAAGVTRYAREIDLGDVAAGVYLLVVEQGGQKAVRRIVVE